jgi:hypothetical protein
MIGSMARLAWLAIGGLSALSLAGCGGDGDSTTSQTATVLSTPVSADRPAKLPRRWHRAVSEAAGFSVGVPPGWKQSGSGPALLLSAPGRLVAVSIAADRTDEALSADPRDLAKRTLAGLSGFKGVKAGAPKPFPGRYPGVALDATAARGKTGKQRLRLVILRPDSVAVFTVLGAGSTKLTRAKERKLIDRIARTLRYQPVGVG